MPTEATAHDRAKRTAWRPAELSAQTGIPVRSIYQLIATGALPATRAGKRTLLVLDEDWRAFLQANRTGL